MNIVQKYIPDALIAKLFMVFYAVGVLLYILPFTRELFILITPLTLVLVIFLVGFYHNRWDLKTILLFAFLAVLSFFIEAVGVSYGTIFGTYQYDSGLGFKILNTPIIIGLNWLFLVYASHGIASKITPNKWFIPFLGAGIMVIYDLVLEIAAPLMNLWHFSGDFPPLQNFTSWFLISFSFHCAFVLFSIKVDNIPARKLFWIQIVFFALISLYYYTFIYNCQ